MSVTKTAMGLLAFFTVTALGGLTTVCPFLAPVTLPALGFGAAGPVAATLAAGAQSYVGNVVAGSTFAALQTMAMAAPTP